ncbi:MAG: HAD family hydrolase [Synergistaceae bacterium]|nr:HAD family hydrolase [Synergistaceae bacterium]
MMAVASDAKAFLFDFDMTLADSSYTIHNCTNLLAEHFGLNGVTREQVLYTIGFSIEQSWRHLFGDFKEEWLKYYRENFRGLEESGLRLFPNAVATLEALRSNGYKVGVVTNRHFAMRPIKATGLEPLLDVVVGLEDGNPPKPDPYILLKGSERIGVLPSETIYVGDTDIDMKTSVAASVRGIGMTTGNFDGEQLKAAGAWRTLDDLGGIIPLIGR